MKLTMNEIDLDTESVICKSPDGRLEVRVPGYPEACSYIRVVYFPDGGTTAYECVYWDQDEIQEDEDACAFGAAMAAIKTVFDGSFKLPERSA